MTMKAIAIPLYGKMAARSYHAPELRSAFLKASIQPNYFTIAENLKGEIKELSHYFELKTSAYDSYVEKHIGLKFLKELRRFGVRTETTDLRLREKIEQALFLNKPISYAWMQALIFDLLRRLPNIAQVAQTLEEAWYQITIHRDVLQQQNIDCALTPGMGGVGFYNECLLAREVQRLNKPVFASITNYDNLVNMGYRGYQPNCVGVWSQQMADDAIRFQGLKAKQIEVTGPVQYDRYFQPVQLSKDQFFKKHNLDINKPTILFAGGVNIARYFEIYRWLIDPNTILGSNQYNIIFRVYPHQKLLSAPAWKVLESLLLKAKNVYISNSLEESAGDSLSLTSPFDELQCLLKYSDVMINIFSTISLEAAICDLPTIHLGFDDYTYGLKYGVTSLFQMRQTHNMRKLRLAAAQVVKNETQLKQALEQYLNNRQLNQSERHQYALAECGYLDGHSSQRLVQMISSRLGGLS